MLKKTMLLILIGCLCLCNCTKTEGVGGHASVTGQLNVDVWLLNNYQHTIGAQGADIHVVYGTDDQIADDKIETGYTGKFEIHHLRPGNYTIYAYSDCFSCPLGADSVVLKEFNITSKRQELSLDPITIIDRK